MRSLHKYSDEATKEDQNYCLREAVINDSALLSELGARAFREAFESFMSPFTMDAHIAATYNQSRQMDELADSSKKILIIEQGGIAAGYALLHAHESPLVVRDVNSIELSRIYLRQDFIGHGLGRALMLECLEEARRRDHKSIWLAVWEKNERAVSFYGKFGFERVGIRPKNADSSAGEDLIMCRLL